MRTHRLAGILVRGVSVAGVATSIDLPEMKVALDLGRASESLVPRRTVLLSHGHIDHMGALPWHAAMRGLRGMDPPTYVVPRENEQGVRRLFEAWRALDGARLPHRLVPLSPGEEWSLGPDARVRPFRCPHPVPCQGYGIWSARSKLKPSFRGLAEEELRRLRVEEGVEISEVVEEPLVAFAGDTRIEVVEREEVVRRARLLILEVSFVDERVSVEACRARGHVHLFELAERADLLENQAILLTHFSARYRPAEILEALERHLPPGLAERTTALLP